MHLTLVAKSQVLESKKMMTLRALAVKGTLAFLGFKAGMNWFFSHYYNSVKSKQLWYNSFCFGLLFRSRHVPSIAGRCRIAACRLFGYAPEHDERKVASSGKQYGEESERHQGVSYKGVRGRALK